MNSTFQRAKSSKQFPQYPEFNARLDKLESGFNNAFRKLLNDGIQPNNALFKKVFEQEISDIKVKPLESLYSHLLKLIFKKVH